ncbi:UNVERIFIED_CONTAM: protein TRANSPARENT TESTA 9, partial [Sesamum angustifolium]
GDDAVNRFVSRAPHADYFLNLVKFFRDQCIHLNLVVSNASKEALLSFVTSGDDVQVSGSLSVLATLLQTKELDESMVDALGILPQRKQHKKKLLVLDALVSLFCRSNISAETLWDGGWLLRQLLPYSEAEFNSRHLRLLKDSFRNCTNHVIEETRGTWSDLLVTTICDEWRKCKRVDGMPCRIAFERGKERHFHFLALSMGTSGWLVLAEELPMISRRGIVRVAAPLAGCNPRIDDKHPRWLHLRIRPSSFPFTDTPKYGAHGKVKSKSLVDGRWTLAFRDEESCKHALSMILEEVKLQSHEVERSLRPLLELDRSSSPS